MGLGSSACQKISKSPLKHQRINNKKGGLVRLKFKNWEDYNKRAKEYKNPVWFSFSNDFATNRNFFDFSDQNRLIFIYLLCEASQQNEQGLFTIDVDHFAYITRQKTKDILQTIEKMVEKQILEGRDRAGIVAGSSADRGLAVTEQDRTEQDILSSTSAEVSEADEGSLKTTDLVNLWNRLANPSLARVIKLTDGRRRAISRALKEYPEAEFWQDVIQAVNKSQFLTGQGAVSGNRSKPWRCDLDFIVRSDNAIKILEGKYS